MLFSLVLVLAAQAAPLPAAAADTLVAVYDTPATRALVERTIAESGNIPAGLQDYQAKVFSAIEMSLASDSTLGGEIPVSVDELASTVRWSRGGGLEQRVEGHRIRLSVPAPYTLGTILDRPWVIPHLYGPTIQALSVSLGGSSRPRGGPRALHPFSARGPLFYRYIAGDTVRIRVQGELVTLVPVQVLPRGGDAGDNLHFVVGTFFLDVDRGAVARARFGFIEAGGRLRMGEFATFVELENGLWKGKFWLPYRQRREIQFASPLLGGGAASRIVNIFTGYQLNTGWAPEPGQRVRLIRAATEDSGHFGGWKQAMRSAAEDDPNDFADLRRLAMGGGAAPGTVDVSLHYERPDHLFRYNRVEGAFAGLGVRLAPAGAAPERWQLYATGGWAAAEETARGELTARLLRPAWSLSGGAYRRLIDIRTFEPSLRWDLTYTLPALFGGSDLRDYYDAAGAELSVRSARGPWSGRLGLRAERQDSLARNTNHFLFGTAEEFPPLAPVTPGTHVALEGELRVTRGAGALDLRNSVAGTLRAEAGVADFNFARATILFSARRELGPLTLVGRFDGGTAFGALPPQKLFRFGAAEGLRGYNPDEFAGSSAALGRMRLLIGLPPYGAEPLARSGPLIIPPLQPAFVLLGEAGRAGISGASRPALASLGAATTGGPRGSVGAGFSIFNDFFTVEWIRPLEGGRDGRWYIGLVSWY